MILRETTVREAIEGALGTFEDSVQPKWGYALIRQDLSYIDSLTRDDVMDILEEEEGEFDGG